MPELCDVSTIFQCSTIYIYKEAEGSAWEILRFFFGTSTYEVIRRRDIRYVQTASYTSSFTNGDFVSPTRIHQVPKASTSD